MFYSVIILLLCFVAVLVGGMILGLVSGERKNRGRALKKLKSNTLYVKCDYTHYLLLLEYSEETDDPKLYLNPIKLEEKEVPEKFMIREIETGCEIIPYNPIPCQL